MEESMIRFAGIDIGSQFHFVAVLNAEGRVLCKPTSCDEDAAGYDKLVRLLGAPEDLLVVMEATGHYWQNVFQHLHRCGYRSSVVNPLRTRRFADAGLRRAKSDKLDALDIARFGAQMRPEPTDPPDAQTVVLRELFQSRERLVQDLGDRVRQLHRLVDLVFPEFTRFVTSLDGPLATTILARHPTATALAAARPHQLARLVYDGRHRVPSTLAENLVQAAKTSVGAHQDDIFGTRVRFFCRDINHLRDTVAGLQRELALAVARHPVASLLATIDGIGTTTAACLVASVGDPARFRSPAALASYVGAVPASSSSGLHSPARAPLTRLGNASVRSALWMPTLAAVKVNPLLRPYYTNLRARGKLPKVALIASMRKLLTVVYAVAKRRSAFQPEAPTRGAKIGQ
jgi:transposase